MANQGGNNVDPWMPAAMQRHGTTADALPGMQLTPSGDPGVIGTVARVDPASAHNTEDIQFRNAVNVDMNMSVDQQTTNMGSNQSGSNEGFDGARGYDAGGLGGLQPVPTPLQQGLWAMYRHMQHIGQS